MINFKASEDFRVEVINFKASEDFYVAFSHLSCSASFFERFMLKMGYRHVSKPLMLIVSLADLKNVAENTFVINLAQAPSSGDNFESSRSFLDKM